MRESIGASTCRSATHVASSARGVSGRTRRRSSAIPACDTTDQSGSGRSRDGLAMITMSVLDTRWIAYDGKLRCTAASTDSTRKSFVSYRCSHWPSTPCSVSDDRMRA